MRFEVWLLGNTKSIQQKYWELSKDTAWNKDKTDMHKYAILVHTLVENPDFDNLEVLSQSIESNLIKASDEILNFVKSLN